MIFIYIYTLFIIALIIKGIIKIRKKQRRKKTIKLTSVTNDNEPKEITDIETVQEFPYKKKNLLTKSEFRFFMMLKAAAQSENILVCPKVRLEDFIQTTSVEEKMKYRGYIRSRHVDFLLIDDKTLHILAAIELDDETHYNAKSQKIDSFKNNLFNAVGIPLLRIKPGSDFGAVIANIMQDIKTQNNNVAAKQPEA